MVAAVCCCEGMASCSRSRHPIDGRLLLFVDLSILGSDSGIVHRDIKLENYVFSGPGPGEVRQLRH